MAADFPGVVGNGMNTSAEWLEPPADEEEGLRRYVETIRERIWLVVLTIVITTGISVAYVLFAQKTYEATANLLVTSVATDDAAIRSLPLIFESSDPTRDVETGSQFVNNTDTAASVKQELNLSESPQDLLKPRATPPRRHANWRTPSPRRRLRTERSRSTAPSMPSSRGSRRSCGDRPTRQSRRPSAPSSLSSRPSGTRRTPPSALRPWQTSHRRPPPPARRSASPPVCSAA
jgi:hypothetical protein